MTRPFRKVERIDFKAPVTWYQLDTMKLCHHAGISAKLEEKGWLCFVGGVRTYVNPRIKRALGYANFRRGTIELNAKYLRGHRFNRKTLERKMLETFVHEVAHHLTYEFLEYRGHGKQWKDLMLWLGYKPARLGKL